MKNFCEDLFFLFFGDRLKNFCEDFFFFWRALALVSFWSLALASSIPVLGLESVCPRKGCPWPWPRIFFCVLGLGLEPCVLDSTSECYCMFILLQGRQRSTLVVFESELPSASCLPHAVENSHCPFYCRLTLSREVVIISLINKFWVIKIFKNKNMTPLSILGC